MTRGIYLIGNLLNGKGYVGSSNNIERRWRRHRQLLRDGQHHSLKLQRAWRRHGADAFSMSILEVVADGMEIFEREQFWIDKLSAHLGGYNAIGKAGHVVPATEDQKAAMSARLKGRTHSPEARAKLSAALTGKIVSEATRAKLRDANLGKKRGPHSAESIAKMKANRAGKPVRLETREKIRAIRTGTTASSETRQKMSEAGRKRWSLMKQQQEA